MASRKAALEGQPSGLSAAKMTKKQFDLLKTLLSEYADNMPEQLAQARMEQIKKAGTNMFFAWAGVEQRGGPHYYRIQAPAFLIEYDNTQNNANHIHSVWRDFNGDFGLDLLAMHYQSSHGSNAQFTGCHERRLPRTRGAAGPVPCGRVPPAGLRTASSAVYKAALRVDVTMNSWVLSRPGRTLDTPLAAHIPCGYRFAGRTRQGRGIRIRPAAFSRSGHRAGCIAPQQPGLLRLSARVLSAASSRTKGSFSFAGATAPARHRLSAST